MPQMVNFEALGGVNFQKGCYPGQEIVARASTAARSSGAWSMAKSDLKPGEQFNGGIVVDSAGGEALAVMPV